jgi:hypothetical protein
MVAPNPRKSVLVLLHPDGFVEVYSDKTSVDARILCVPQMSSPAGEILAEQYVETMLTNRYRDVFYPGNRIALGNYTTITPELIAKRNDEIRLARMFDEVKALSSKAVAS